MLGPLLDPARDDPDEMTTVSWGTFNDPQDKADDLNAAFFQGAAFSPDGSELRVNAGWKANDVAMFRIFDHALKAAE